MPRLSYMFPFRKRDTLLQELGTDRVVRLYKEETGHPARGDGDLQNSASRLTP